MRVHCEVSECASISTKDFQSNVFAAVGTIALSSVIPPKRMSIFDRPDLPRPACFDKSGIDWTPEEFHKCVHYLFSGCNLTKNVALAKSNWTHHLQDAEDALHDYYASTFFARKTVARFNPAAGSFESWHNTMFAFGGKHFRFPFLRSWCLKRSRYGRAKLLSPEEWEFLFNEVESEGRGPDDSTEMKDKMKALDECLDKLSESDRDYVSRFGGHRGPEEEKHREICNALSISEPAGRKRLSRAREKLRRCLRDRGITMS
ncbi:MAG TPA: sigma-70 family RNA polymerase sigma factor [Chthoniobacterales bacterium]|nr:sigma-70 family RNA polymerase sigma factor [Chthoniobacterales bacterium]